MLEIMIMLMLLLSWGLSWAALKTDREKKKYKIR